MATINVSTTAQLKTALSSAHGGDTILLATRTYSGVSLADYHFSSAVTITSANAADPAKLTDLNIKNSSGLTFSKLELIQVPARMSTHSEWKARPTSL